MLVYHKFILQSYEEKFKPQKMLTEKYHKKTSNNIQHN